MLAGILSMALQKKTKRYKFWKQLRETNREIGKLLSFFYFLFLLIRFNQTNQQGVSYTVFLTLKKNKCRVRESKMGQDQSQMVKCLTGHCFDLDPKTHLMDGSNGLIVDPGSHAPRPLTLTLTLTLLLPHLLLPPSYGFVHLLFPTTNFSLQPQLGIQLRI